MYGIRAYHHDWDAEGTVKFDEEIGRDIEECWVPHMLRSNYKS